MLTLNGTVPAGWQGIGGPAHWGVAASSSGSGEIFAVMASTWYNNSINDRTFNGSSSGSWTLRWGSTYSAPAAVSRPRIGRPRSVRPSARFSNEPWQVEQEISTASSMRTYRLPSPIASWPVWQSAQCMPRS